MTENTNTIAQTIEQNAPVLVKKIGKTTYMVGIHFSETSKETMDDKVARLVKSDIHKQACVDSIIIICVISKTSYKFQIFSNEV